MTAQMISHYRIIRKLGEGGMGEVYLAQDTKLDRKVAIKSLPLKSLPDEEATRRLIREAQAAAKLDHPNICTVHDEVEEGNRSFIIMQYVEGETLFSKIDKAPLAVRESLDIALQVADALAELHSHGIVHRDIKPQNIIISPGGQVKVLDFGLAKVLNQEIKEIEEADTISPGSASDGIAGTPPYMSPEQATQAPVDARSDIFSLGALLYKCLAGRPAFTGSNAIEICSNVIHVDPPPPSQFNRSIPPELDRITLKALAKKTELRYQSAIELFADLCKVHDMLQAKELSSRRFVFLGVFRQLSRALRSMWSLPRVWPADPQSGGLHFRRRLGRAI